MPISTFHANLINNGGFRYSKPPTEVKDVGNVVHAKEKMVVSLIESRNRDVGVCYANRDFPSVITITQWVDHPTYMHTLGLLMRLDPDAIVISRNALGSEFVNQIGLRYPAKVTIVDRKHFDETFGKEKIDRCMIKPTTSLNPYFCACSAFGAMWRYFEWTIDCTLQADFTEVVLERPANQLLLDPQTLKSLEVLAPIKSTDQTPLQPAYGLSSLFRPCTPTGTRRLRQAMQAPNASLPSLRRRLSTVEKMVNNPVPLEALREELSKLGDMELTIKKATAIPRVLKVDAWAYKTIEAFFLVGSILAATPRIKEHLKLMMGDDPDLTNIFSILDDDDILGMEEVIKRMINMDCKPKNKSERQSIFYAIRPGTDEVLDCARELWTETLAKVYYLHREYTAEYPKLQVRLEAHEKHGYILTHKPPPKEDGKLPPEFMLVPNTNTKKNVLYSTTPRLTDLNVTFKRAEKELYLRIMMCLESASDFLRARQLFLHNLIHALTTLDFISTLADYSIVVSGVKPEFIDDSPIIIMGAKHPIKSYYVKYVGNDFFFPARSSDFENASNLRIITGYNGGGKTSRLQTLGLICILAHVGCFVPCDVCKLPPLKRIFTRMGTQDSIETSSSTFLMEMKEAYEVFRDEADDNCLVLIDELGRGTSHSEGVAFCWAMCEKLKEMKCMTYFATHFAELINMRGAMIEYIPATGEKHKSVMLEPDENRANLDKEHYGIQKSKQLRFPDEVVSMAFEFSKQLHAVFFRPSITIIDRKENPEDVVKLGEVMRKMFDNDDLSVAGLLESFYRSHFPSTVKARLMPDPCPSPGVDVVLPEDHDIVRPPPYPYCTPMQDLASLDCVNYVHPLIAHPRERAPELNREFYVDCMALLGQCKTAKAASRMVDRTAALLSASPTFDDEYFSQAAFHDRADKHTPEDDSHVHQALRQELERKKNGERSFVEEQAIREELGQAQCLLQRRNQKKDRRSVPRAAEMDPPLSRQKSLRSVSPTAERHHRDTRHTVESGTVSIDCGNVEGSREMPLATNSRDRNSIKCDVGGAAMRDSDDLGSATPRDKPDIGGTRVACHVAANSTSPPPVKGVCSVTKEQELERFPSPSRRLSPSPLPSESPTPPGAPAHPASPSPSSFLPQSTSCMPFELRSPIFSPPPIPGAARPLIPSVKMLEYLDLKVENDVVVDKEKSSEISAEDCRERATSSNDKGDWRNVRVVPVDVFMPQMACRTPQHFTKKKPEKQLKHEPHVEHRKVLCDATNVGPDISQHNMNSGVNQGTDASAKTPHQNAATAWTPAPQKSAPVALKNSTFHGSDGDVNHVDALCSDNSLDHAISEGVCSPVNSLCSGMSGYKREEQVIMPPNAKRQKVIYTSIESFYEDWVRHDIRRQDGYISNRAFSEWSNRAWDLLNEEERDKWYSVTQSNLDWIAEACDDGEPVDFSAGYLALQNRCAEREILREVHREKIVGQQHEERKATEENNA